MANLTGMSTPAQRPTPAEAFARLVEIIARLRAPDGCPWDREQTHATLRTHLIEETYEVVDAIERAADDVLLPLTGSTLRSALRVPPPTAGFALEGEGLAFSTAKETDDGAWTVLRCVNLVDEPREGSWTLGVPVREACRSRLDETPGERLTVADDRVAFHAGPREIVTLLVR